jgi:hypothetical protein
VPTLACLALLNTRPPTSMPGANIFRHTLLLLTLATAMFSSLGLAIGRTLLYPGPYPGAFRVIVSIDSIFSSGQGILFLGVFGLDQCFLVQHIVALWKRITARLTYQDMADSFIMIDSNNNGEQEKISMEPDPPAELQIEKEQNISSPFWRSA